MGGRRLCRVGDVLICHSLTAHQGQDNESGDRLRISLDYRYQPMSHPVREDSLEPHMHFTDWEDIYAKWDADDPLKYYWRTWDLQINPAHSVGVGISGCLLCGAGV